jgi:molybdate transport system ATP-binding protein
MLKAALHAKRGDFALHAEFEVPARTIGLFGKSGAGKTTLLHLLCGLLKPARGRLSFADEVLFDGEAGLNLPAHRRRVGVVFQEDRLLPHISVRRNLRYALKRARVVNPHLGFDQVVSELELESLLQRRVHDLSGGEKQRAALGRALLASPRALLLDEPLVSLDAGSKTRILRFLRRLQAQAPMPILYVSHELTEVLQLTSELILMEAGQVIRQGSYLELTEHPEVLRAVGEQHLSNVLRVQSQGIDQRTGLMCLQLGDRSEAPILFGSPLAAEERPTRIAIRPEDIALSQQRLEGTSIRNQLRGRIERITVHERRALVLVNIGVPLLVRVSVQTVREMQLEPGREVWCLIKAAAVRYLDS